MTTCGLSNPRANANAAPTPARVRHGKSWPTASPETTAATSSTSTSSRWSSPSTSAPMPPCRSTRGFSAFFSATGHSRRARSASRRPTKTSSTMSPSSFRRSTSSSTAIRTPNGPGSTTGSPVASAPSPTSSSTTSALLVSWESRHGRRRSPTCTCSLLDQNSVSTCSEASWTATAPPGSPRRSAPRRKPWPSRLRSSSKAWVATPGSPVASRSTETETSNFVRVVGPTWSRSPCRQSCARSGCQERPRRGASLGSTDRCGRSPRSSLRAEPTSSASPSTLQISCTSPNTASSPTTRDSSWRRQRSSNRRAPSSPARPSSRPRGDAKPTPRAYPPWAGATPARPWCSSPAAKRRRFPTAVWW